MSQSSNLLVKVFQINKLKKLASRSCHQKRKVAYWIVMDNLFLSFDATIF
jgi:hypothetical protein